MTWISVVLGTGSRGTKARLSTPRVVEHWGSNAFMTAVLPSPRIIAMTMPRNRIFLQSPHCRMRRHWIHSSPRTRSTETTVVQPSRTTNLNSTSTSTTNTVIDANTVTAPAVLPNKSRRGGHHPRITYIWTPEMDRQIIDMRLEGDTWQEIGAALGRDFKAIRLRYKKELDPALLRDWTPAKVEYLNTSVTQGKNWRQISEELLMTQSACREKWLSVNPQMALQTKVKPRPRPKAIVRSVAFKESGLVGTRRYKWCDQMDALMLSLKDRGLNWRQIGSAFGMVPMTCYMRYRHRLIPRLKSGWAPPKLDTSNAPYYLLPNRHRPDPNASACAAETSTENNSTDNSTIDSNSVSTDDPDSICDRPSITTPLGAVSNDFLYNTFDQPPLHPRTWTKEEDDYIIKSREEDASFKAIGIHLNLEPRDCSHRYYSTLYLPSKNKEWTHELVEKLLYYVEQGLGWTTIANDLGIHRIVCKEKYRELTQPETSSSSTKSRDAIAQNAKGHTSIAATSSYPGPDMVEDNDNEDVLEEYERDEDHLDQQDDNIIDELRGDYRSDYDGYGDDDGDDDDDDDDSGDDMLDVDVPEDGEGFTDDDIIRTGRWSKKQKPISPSTTTVHDVWDRESFVREVKKRWTPEEETTLIQHVIRNGTRAWQEISDALAGRHSAEECQGYWKHLDMPVRRAEKQSYKWEPHKEALFWRLWLESGSDFDEISRKLCNFKGFEGAGALQSSDQGQSSTSSRITIQDCEELFTQRTQQLRKVAGEQQDDEVFRNDCVEMALMLSKPSPFKWDKEKSVKLQKLVRQRLKSRDIQVNWINWRWVARHVGGGVTAQRCCVHWRQLRKVEIDKESWTDEDILLLEQGIREIGPTFNHPDNQSTSSPPSATAAAAVSVDNSGSSSEPNLTGFRAIQRFYLPDRSIEAMQRKYFLLSDKGSTVTMREYMSVMDAVDEYGLDQWDKVVEALKSSLSSSSPSASGAQGSSFVGWTKAPCRRVWEASYRHHLLYTPWTFEEDRDLKESVDRIGLQEWVAVSRFFPGKSAWQCRLRWCQLTDPIQPAQSAAPLPDHL